MPSKSKYKIENLTHQDMTYRFTTRNREIAMVIKSGNTSNNMFDIINGKYDKEIREAIKNNNKSAMNVQYKYDENDVIDIFIVKSQCLNGFVQIKLHVEMENGKTFQHEMTITSIDYMIDEINDGKAEYISAKQIH